MNLSYTQLVSVEHIYILLALALLIPIAVLFIECLAALLPNQKQVDLKAASLKSRPKVAVLIPAYNEEALIGKTLASVLPQLTKQDELIVIADNCSDRTVEIAREYTATVIERKNTSHRGKGYALDCGIEFVSKLPPEVVIILDGDCIIAPNTIEHLTRQAIATGRPVQATYLMEQPDETSLKDRISMFALTVKNFVRLLGLNRLGYHCLLTGSGMAFPWSIISQVPLADDNLVEDMQLGIDLAIAGYSPLFCSTAKVIGALPRRSQAATIQKTRWEHGHLSTLRTQVPRLLKEAWMQRRLDLVFMALDLSVPPLSLLVTIWFVVTVMGITAGILQGQWNLGIYLTIFEGILLVVAILAAWAKFGRQILSLKALLSIPVYVFWKLPIYFAFFNQPQQQWIRTEREVPNSQLSKSTART
ncbi:glycosyltransferase family 2 protein [Myxosarcina sp. GI1]|uniref:glycosyltransferase family 2 protein n=1 Tax=Myxosarcina sp. GI1 TaxID=1541065 RepID=UPI00056C0FBC|nr:glycosyltransferase family 2 protein [Myxosarcina sp. GI1]